MKYEITLRSRLHETQLKEVLGGLLSTTPFVMGRFAATAEQTFRMSLMAKRQDIVISFAKFAEVQLLLARHGNVVEFRQIDEEQLRAVS